MAASRSRATAPWPRQGAESDQDGSIPAPYPPARSEQPKIPRPAGSAGGAKSERLLVATLQVRIPNSVWTGPFSRKHPTTIMEILGRSEVGRKVLVADHWISGRPPGVWRKEIARYPDVLHVDCLTEVGEGSLYRVRFLGPSIVKLYRRLEVPIPFPLRIQAGYIQWEVVARTSQFREILRFVRSIDPKAKIAWTRKSPLRAHVPQLTKAQTSLLQRAIAAGYFAVPRRITLIDLAREVNRSKSAVSETMARIELKLLESALYLPSFGT